MNSCWQPRQVKIDSDLGSMVGRKQAQTFTIERQALRERLRWCRHVISYKTHAPRGTTC
jgi:hypothetical protein